MTKKYKGFRINEIKIEAQEQYGDWEDYSSIVGNRIFGGKTLLGLKKEINKFFDMVLIPSKNTQIKEERKK